MINSSNSSNRHALKTAGTTTLIISNEEMEDVMKIVKCLKDSGLLIKSFSKTIQNEAKNQKDGFLGMLLGSLSASLLGNCWQ